jgi:luciferase family oxidoreductase group 1
VVELQGYFAEPEADQRVQAVPGAGLRVPLWILGSSLYGAQLAAMLGLPYAFASHFAPNALMPALELYRREFRPSAQLEAPYVAAGFNVFAAESDAEGHLLRTSARKSTLSLRRGQPRTLPPPDPDFEAGLSPDERMMLDAQGACSAVGAAETVLAQMRAFAARTGVDELILTGQIFDHAARLKSFEIAMSEWSRSSS